MQQGAEDVDRAALEAFAADKDLSPVTGLIGELPAAGDEVTKTQPPTAGVAARGDHEDDLGDLGMVAADGGPGMFQGGDQAAGGTVDRWRGGHGLVSWPGAGMAGGADGWPLSWRGVGGRAWNWATKARA
jgi:hypothetical protein